jgi:DNA-binding transcriptional LysR family regulator
MINRTTRRQSYGDGMQLYERSWRILAEVEAAEAFAGRDCARAIPSGQIRVNAPVILASNSRAAKYLAAYPKVDVELTRWDPIVGLIVEGYEAILCVLMRRLANSGLIARSLRPMEFVLCAAPAYIDAHGTPTAADELRSHECLGFAYGVIRDQWSFVRRGGRRSRYRAGYGRQRAGPARCCVACGTRSG